MARAEKDGRITPNCYVSKEQAGAEQRAVAEAENL